jgi:hypothetical protein
MIKYTAKNNSIPSYVHDVVRCVRAVVEASDMRHQQEQGDGDKNQIENYGIYTQQQSAERERERERERQRERDREREREIGYIHGTADCLRCS